MIQITMQNNILKVKGHSMSAESGRDIICSAASMLTNTLAQSMLNMYSQKWLRKKPNIKLEEGNAEVIVKPKKEYENEVKFAFDIIATGFQLLSATYPQFVKFSWNEE